MKKRMFSRRFAQKTAASDFSPPQQGNLDFQRPGICLWRAAESRCRERGMLEKHAYARGRLAPGMRGGGPDSVVFGRRLSAKKHFNSRGLHFAVHGLNGRVSPPQGAAGV